MSDRIVTFAPASPPLSAPMLDKDGATREVEVEVVSELYTNNDAGRARRFIYDHRDSVRYVHAFERWLIWTGNHWQPDEDGGITRLAMEHSQRLIAEAAQIANRQAQFAAVKEALELGNVHRIERMLALAKCDQRIIVSRSALDSDPFLLGVPNGVIELRTGIFRKGLREDLVTKRAGAAYVPSATCPRWLAFLDEVLGGDAELIAYVQAFVGYTLTGDVSGQCFIFLFGYGKNGKSVFTEILQALLREYGQRAPQSLLTASHNGHEPRNEIARLHGARLVVGSETEEGARLAESRIKDLTGGDTLTGRLLYAEAFDFKARLKLWLFGNHKPEIRGTDDGIWRRVRLIPFTVKIPEARRDTQLQAKLTGELSGILNWALEGTRRFLASGLIAPQAVIAASADYRDEEDLLGDFIRDEIEHDPDSRIDTGDVFSRYKEWADRYGLRHPLNRRTLTKRLGEHGLRSVKTHGKNCWEGIALK